MDREDVVAAKHAAMTSVGASCDGVLRRLHLECLLCSCFSAVCCCMISGTFSRTTRLLKPWAGQDCITNIDEMTRLQIVIKPPCERHKHSQLRFSMMIEGRDTQIGA